MSDWTEVTVNEVPYTLTGLTPETYYEWQIQGVNANCSGLEWTEIQNFTTTEQTTATQTIALVEGFNWISANVEITLDDLKAALVAALPGTTITINSQNGGSTTYNGTRWRGSLNLLDLSQMYMIETTAAGEMTLEGMPIVPSEHPANIFVGNNWIAFPLTQSMTLANAFVGFPVNGDQVTSQDNGFSTYNNRWRGTLTTLDPNKGYLYFSASPNDRTLTFPSSK